ncbi:MAG: aminotransferase class III-fold pyridoxal phosphate-dependent enzyme, partial [Burkholderiaceae bacterium]
TFGGNPLAMRAALEVLAVMEDDKLLDNAAACGAIIKSGMARELAGVAGLVEIRGGGLMIGIELDRPCAEIVAQAREAGLLINVTGERVIRLLPPLIINAEQIGMIVNILAPIVRSFLHAQAEAKAA